MSDRAELTAERDRVVKQLEAARRAVVNADGSAGRHKYIRKLERELVRIGLELREIRERGL